MADGTGPATKHLKLEQTYEHVSDIALAPGDPTTVQEFVNGG